MILVDSNLLLYAYVPSLPQHAKAKQWLEEALNGAGLVGLPWPSLLSFVRIITNRRVFARAWSVEAAWSQVEEWLRLDNVWIPQATERHPELLRSLLHAIPEGGGLVSDAHLAALALEHGLILCSTDADFARFRAVRWRNPLS